MLRESNKPYIAKKAALLSALLSVTHLTSVSAETGPGSPYSQVTQNRLTSEPLHVGAAIEDADISEPSHESHDPIAARESLQNPINYNHQPLFQAPIIKSDPATKELNVILSTGYAHHRFKTFVHGQEEIKNLYLRGYNGQLVGPTLVAKPGDVIKIKLANNMPHEDSQTSCHDGDHCDHNQPHNFNTTNLHTHGLHVDPKGNSDNVFVQVPPGEAFDYEIKIPDDHAAGTFWYHAHLHGSSSVQVGSGMAGALIIKGDYDRLPSIKAAKKKVLIFQEIAFDENGRIENNDNYGPTAWPDMAAKMGWHISVNGRVMPEITARPKELQLWRLIAGGVRKYLNLKLVNACSKENVPLIQLAADGIAFNKKRRAPDGGVFLAPGYRNDVAVKVPSPGVYYLIDNADAPEFQLPDSYCDSKRAGAPLVLDENAQHIVARVSVYGEPAESVALPKNSELAQLNRPASIHEHQLSDEVQLLEFDIDLSVTPWKGLINGKPYDPNYQRTLRLGDAQTWKVSSAFSHHPFHIHVNPFEVIERDSSGMIVDRYWKDTLVIPEKNPDVEGKGVIELRMRYDDFSGAFVTHCHILDHEDHGMMEKVVIESL